MAYWLMKTEPNAFSIDDLKKAGVEPWDGIRNYQARNFMRDSMKVGDGVLIYHSRIQPIGIVGEAKVASKPYPDPTQFNPKEKYHDPKSDPENPRWILVDIEYVRHFPQTLNLTDLKKMPELAEMVLVQKGSRLSIQPVTLKQWRFIQKLTEQAPKT